MADLGKLRSREKYLDYVVSEHVWVDGTYFDDPKAPFELRYSTSHGANTKIYGIIQYVSITSNKIVFEDGTTSDILKCHVNLVPTNIRREPVNNGRLIKDDESCDKNDDEENPGR